LWNIDITLKINIWLWNIDITGYTPLRINALKLI
jgi:hypothetical protein